MNGRCETDPLDRAVDVCDSCYGEFCAPCLVTVKGRRRPYCQECATIAAGLRGSAKPELRGSRRTARKRRAELAAANTDNESVFSFFDDDQPGREDPGQDTTDDPASADAPVQQPSFTPLHEVLGAKDGAPDGEPVVPSTPAMARLAQLREAQGSAPTPAPPPLPSDVSTNPPAGHETEPAANWDTDWMSAPIGSDLPRTGGERRSEEDADRYDPEPPPPADPVDLQSDWSPPVFEAPAPPPAPPAPAASAAAPVAAAASTPPPAPSAPADDPAAAAVAAPNPDPVAAAPSDPTLADHAIEDLGFDPTDLSALDFLGDRSPAPPPALAGTEHATPRDLRATERVPSPLAATESGPTDHRASSADGPVPPVRRRRAADGDGPRPGGAPMIGEIRTLGGRRQEDLFPTTSLASTPEPPPAALNAIEQFDAGFPPPPLSREARAALAGQRRSRAPSRQGPDATATANDGEPPAEREIPAALRGVFTTPER